MGAQHFNNFQHEVGTRCAFHHFACQLKANDFWDQHGNWLAKHCCFGFNPANTPTQNSKAVYHGCVRISSDECIRIRDFNTVLIFVGPDSLRQILEVHLMTDACARRNNAEVVKRFLAPLKECVPLKITFIFAVHVHLECTRVTEFINHDRVVDDQINRVQRVNLLGVATKGHDTIAHRCKVNHGRNACEILHQNTGRAVGDLARVFTAIDGPVGERFDIVYRHGEPAVFKPQHVF